jgi:DNA-directed RNA polymerase specialized sigma24 family protein
MPVILKDIEGLSLDRICEILEIPLGTAKSRINRGRRILQDALQGYYYGRLE